MNWFEALRGGADNALGDVDEDFRVEYLIVGAMFVAAFMAWEHDPLVSVGIVGSQALFFGYLVVRARLRRKSRDEDHVRRIAKKAGLRFARPGEFDLYRMPFPIFRAGEWQGFDHVYVGDWGGDRVWVFDYWHGFELRGQDVEEYSTCAAIELANADCPKLSVTRENPWSRTWGHLGWRDIEIESEDFNRRFDVSGDDERFAFAFLSPSMIRWLQATPKNFEFAVEGRWVLCRSRWLPTERWWDLLRMARDFRAHIPETLSRLWPDVRR